VPVNKLHPPPGEALEGVGLRRVDDILDDTGDHSGRVAQGSEPHDGRTAAEQRIQAWREVNELKGRTLMRAGAWII
jgi:hypothetical protein